MVYTSLVKGICGGTLQYSGIAPKTLLATDNLFVGLVGKRNIKVSQ